jgi:hypothetical protein
MNGLGAVLPARHSPLQASGNGLQPVYPTEIPQDFAEVLAGLVGAEAPPFMTVVDIPAGAAEGRAVTGDNLDVLEHRLEEQVASDTSIKELTTKQSPARDVDSACSNSARCRSSDDAGSLGLTTRFTSSPSTASLGAIQPRKNSSMVKTAGC